jgi:hypothetical protein
MKMYPTGKGVYLWIIKRIFDGDPERIALAAKDMGFSWIVIKVLESFSEYNLVNEGNAWVDTLAPLLVNSLKEQGIKVYGYQFIYLDRPEQEANAAARRVDELGLDGFIIDAESQVYYKFQQAKTYAAKIRLAMPDMPVGLASFRFPSYHRDVPWEELLGCCSFHNPQVYWEGKHNAGEQLVRSYNELRSIVKLPVVPIGSAYDEHGWKPRPSEIEDFWLTAQRLELPGATFWEWFEIIQNDYTELIKGLSIESDNEEPSTPPQEKDKVIIVDTDGNDLIIPPGRYRVECKLKEIKDDP